MNLNFQQDGATVCWRLHASRLRDVSRKGNFTFRRHPITPRSPDLSPWDFLWGHPKAQVYTHHPRSLVELTDEMKEEVDSSEGKPSGTT